MDEKRDFSLTEFLLAPQLSSKTPSEEHVKKWLEYRAGNGPTDPDNTPEAYTFYSYLWGEEIAHWKLVDTCPFPVYIQGDWICSVWTTLRLGLKIIDSQALENAGIALGDDGCPTVKSCLTNRKLLENFDRFKIFKDQRIYDFIYNAHTRANLIIVPKGLNSKRGGAPTNDYWDKALERLLQPISITTENKSLMEYAEFFQRLISKFGIDENDEAFKIDSSKAPLFLKEWINEDRNPKWILNKKKWQESSWNKLVKSITENEWWDLVEEMTGRIIGRREKMQTFIDSLTHE